MADPRPLGELEQLILLAILRLGPDAYGLSIARELEDQAGRRLSRGALYTSLDRLETKGFLRWSLEPGGPARQELPKRVYTVLPRGSIRAAILATNPPRAVARARSHPQGGVVTGPPRFFDWLLRRSLPHGPEGDSIRGDLLEELEASANHRPRDSGIARTCSQSSCATVFTRLRAGALKNGETRWKRFSRT